MRPAKKLQVFVSSTYTDLRDERQAAVEAILTAGHIPAGMELFTAGDESQMDVIRRWIDESDVFLLILAGRYGSLEPVTGKSYIHLEYEYATGQGKPLFAVVLSDSALDERVRRTGRGALEAENPTQLRDFRELVLSKISEFWSDHRDIALTIHRKLSEFVRRTDLAGWVPGDQAISAGLLVEEIARLTKENADLRARVRNTIPNQVLYTGVLFQDLLSVLNRERVYVEQLSRSEYENLTEAMTDFADAEPSLLHVFWMLRDEFVPGAEIHTGAALFVYVSALGRFGLVSFQALDGYGVQWRCSLTDDGRRFLLRLSQHEPGVFQEQYSDGDEE